MENLQKYVELFSLISERFDGAELGKKVVQKLFYFYERKGITLNLRYGIHFYGPYSSKLDNALHMLESEEYISIDTSKATHVISVNPLENNIEQLTGEEKNIAIEVLDAFAHKTPLELEALATMDYVATSILVRGATDEEIIEKFKEIKGSKFNNRSINKTLSELKKLNLIVA